MGKHRLRLLLAAAAGITALLSTAAAGSADAATGGTVPAATRADAVARMHVTVTGHGPTRTTRDAATSTTCYQGVYQRVNFYEAGVLVWWVAMETNFCYNGTTVTSHRTAMSHWVAGSYTYFPEPIKFRCYVAAGSTRNCSGNEESDTSVVSNGDLGLNTTVAIQEWENYHGGWYTHWSTSTV